MAAQDVVTTSMFSCGVHKMLSDEVSYSDLYAYVFDSRITGDEFVEHASELEYIFCEDSCDSSTTLSADMTTYWTNFAKF